MSRQIAIVGYSFRLPGGARRETLWEALRSGEDLVSTVDEDRWAKMAFFHPRKSEPGTSYTFDSGSVGDVSRFDADFFGISPREAAQMDPQQRLLLEFAWEAFEDAGVKPSAMKGTRCGVYIGLSSIDYAYRRADDLASIDASTMTGNTASIAANRISYWFDLKGPSIAVDTACSSSLVAFHLACRSIESGECTHALTGGISLHLHPFGFVGFSKASMLSRQGRCRVFDASGDGYVRSEGGGIFLLKNLHDALADGDRIYAIVAASGTNCDGRTHGITVPGRDAQANLLQEVYERAGILADQVDYLEAHGTGTAVGDPIEASAIARSLGQSRPSSSPLLIGSVKSNIGHLEAASGVAGLVKALLCLEHRCIPPSIHLSEPNPQILFDQWNIKVVTENTPLDPEKKLIVGVNSFGFGGANAHVILESGRMPNPPDPHGPSIVPPLLLSARSESALRSSALAYAEHLTGQASDGYYDIAYAAAFHREFHDHRLIAFGPDRESIARSLRSFGAAEPASHISAGSALSEASPRAAFVYSGNGSQWAGMGKTLLQQDPAFRDAILATDEIFAQHGTFSIVSELQRDDGSASMELTEIAQPTLFAVQVGLTQMLRGWGLNPSAVIGHSVGEVAAAWACGALSLEQAVAVIAVRSHEQGTTRGTGSMTAVGMGVTEIKPLLASLGLSETLAIAGINSPRGVTLAGSVAALTALEGHLVEREVFFRRLALDYAFHSPAMNAIEPAVKASLAELQPRSTRIPFISTVTGKHLNGDQLDGHYWWRNIREPVQFEAAISNLLRSGINVLVEVGPHAVLRNYVADCLRQQARSGRIVPTMSRTDDRLDTIKDAFFQTVVAGTPVDLSKLFPRKGRYVDLPYYPWQRERHWHPVTAEGYDHLGRRKDHSLLGYRLHETDGHQWENHLDTVVNPAYRDHVIGETVVFPAAGFVEMALAASEHWHGCGSHEIEQLEIVAPLLLQGERSKTVRFSIEGPDGSFSIKSRDRLSEESWLLNVTGRLLGASSPAAETIGESLPARAPEVVASEHYRRTASLGLHYGTAFQTVEAVWVEGRSAIATLRRIEPLAEHGPETQVLHPALLDGCFQLLVDLLWDEGRETQGIAFLPTKIGRLVLHQAKPIRIAVVRAAVTRQSPRSVVCRFLLFGATGELVGALSDVRFRAVHLAGESTTERPKRLRFKAVPLPLRGGDAASPLPPNRDLIATLKARLHHVDRGRVRQHYYGEVEPLLDVLCATFAERTLRQLVGKVTAFDIRSLIDAGSVIAEAEPLLLRLAGMLQEDGLIEPTEGGWRWCPESGLPAAEAIWISLIGDYPDYAPILIPAGRVGMHLVEAATGAIPWESLVPRGGLGGLTFSTGYSAAHDFHHALGDIVQAAQTRLPEGQRLRILEIGRGTDSLGSYLLPRIDLDRCDYWMAGCSQADLDERPALSERYPEARYLVVDFEHTDNAPLSHLRHRFDIVLVPEGLARFDDLSSVLTTIGFMLAKDGVLLSVEQYPSRTTDLVFGLQPEWWVRGARGGRKSRLRNARQWRSALDRHGFSYQGVVTDTAGVESGTYVLMARSEVVSPLPVESTAAGTWIVLHDESGYSSVLGASLKGELRVLGHQVVAVTPGDGFAVIEEDTFALDPLSAPQLETLLAMVREKYGEISNVIHLYGLMSDQETPEALLDRQQSRCTSVIRLLNACESAGIQPRCWLVTVRGAAHLLPHEARQSIGPDQLGLQDAVFWGFGRTVMNEHADFELRLIDCADPDRLERMAAGLLTEVLAHEPDDEVILTGSGRYVPRLGTVPSEREGRTADDVPAALRLDFVHPGPLKNLVWRSHERRPPAPDELEIEVRAAGLNFRDVMYAMGLLSDEAVEGGFAGATLGMELSGVVTRVGPAVSEIRPGDPVIAFAPSSFATHAVTKQSAVVAKPEGWSFEAAATVPIAFFTVYYALQHLARLQEGEKILIHGAAGGVGIAAVQLARFLGAEVFASAGSDEKRDFVRLLGADHVLDSRSLAYAEQILRLTDGEGVDVVLNSLTGEAINRNLRILKPFGRFLELGKRDFYENTKIGLRPFRNNIAYFGIDADQLMIERPELTRRLFLELMELFRQGALKPLPYRAFSASDAVAAFRYMQQSRQIGKVVLSCSDRVDSWIARPEETKRLELSGQATYLVTGGLAGFGLRTAQWLVERGARNLVLLSRTGLVAEGAKAAFAAMEAAGADVRTVACDVTDRVALERLLRELDPTCPPIRGIIHAAAVFEDDLARNLSAEQMRRVLAPKIAGALHLDQLTRDLPLDFLVFYSSATTLFGNPGQAHYVAANHFLEALSERRRAQGLPALCVSFGPIADAGYLARHGNIKDGLEVRLGGASLNAAQALWELERLLLENTSGIGLLHLNWRALSRFLPSAAAPKFQLLARLAEEEIDEAGGMEDIQRWVNELNDEQLIPLLLTSLKKEIADILRIPAERLEEHRSIHALGMDSLMGMELITAVESRFGVKLPIMFLSEGPTIARVGEKIVTQLRAAREQPAAGATPVQEVSDQIKHVAAQYAGELSPDRVAELTSAFKHRIQSDADGLMDQA